MACNNICRVSIMIIMKQLESMVDIDGRSKLHCDTVII